MAVAQEKARSRSPIKRFSKRTLPEVNTWVQIITETNPSKRAWAKAVPALVSQVSLCQTKLDVRINVLVPNVLALQYNFQAAKYREFKNLQVAEVRPYLGHDQDKLKSVLLSAFREKAHKNMIAREGQRDIPPQTTKQEASAGPDLTSSPCSRKFVDEDMDTTPENISKFFKSCAEGSAQRSRTREGICQAGSEATLAIATSTSCVSAADDPSTVGRALASSDSQPKTPQASSQKTLVRNITPLDPEFPRLHGGLEEIGSGEKAKCLEQCLAETDILKLYGSTEGTLNQRNDKALKTALAAMSIQRFRELTALIGKAFRTQDSNYESILSKQAIEKAVNNAGGDLAIGELDEAFARLDASNKIMLSDDLVICL